MLTPIPVDGPTPVIIPTLPFNFPPPAFDCTRSCSPSIAAFLVIAASLAVTGILVGSDCVPNGLSVAFLMKGLGRWWGKLGEEGESGGSSSKASSSVDCLIAYRIVIVRERGTRKEVVGSNNAQVPSGDKV